MTAPWPSHPQQPAPRRRRVWPYVAGGVAVVLIVAGIASGGSGNTKAAPAVGGAPATAQAAAPAGPPSFSDGTYEVGADIPAGKYKTTGPPEDAAFKNCYYSRLSNTDGSFGAIIANGNTQGPATLTVKAGDAAVEASGGCVWTKQ